MKEDFALDVSDEIFSLVALVDFDLLLLVVLTKDQITVEVLVAVILKPLVGLWCIIFKAH